MAFTLRSTGFDEGGVIPRPFTCDGGNRTPPLTWSEVPEGTRSLALIMDDPDAPRGTFTHWLLYDIPAAVSDLHEHAAGKSLRNGFGRSGYGGPCPPAGDPPHRYVFTLYALDVPALDVHVHTRDGLEHALENHILGTARLTGRYGRR